MEANWFFLSLQVSVIACAVVSGVFLTFSDFVMQSLNGARPSAGVEVMQVINRKVYRTVFMVLLLGWSALSPVLMIYAWLLLGGQTAFWVLSGSAVYLVGVFAVTLVFNVPMNNRLDRMNFTGADAAAYWSETYFPRWTFWNYVRAIAAAVAAVCFMMAAASMMKGL
ncbi:MAG: DUF1772 domain-containing protein [Alphaproteobacteria bacterium]